MACNVKQIRDLKYFKVDFLEFVSPLDQDTSRISDDGQASTTTTLDQS